MTETLTAAAGAIDVVTFFAFNQVFASTMTGNPVLLGLGIGQREWGQVVEDLCAIGGYRSGLVVGTLVRGVAIAAAAVAQRGGDRPDSRASPG